MEPNTMLDAENEKAMMSDMDTALDKFNTANPTTAASTHNAGFIAQQVVSKLTGAGFSLWTILPKIYVIIQMIQKYGPDIMKIVEEFQKMFTGEKTVE